jgi:hypothetical protein
MRLFRVACFSIAALCGTAALAPVLAGLRQSAPTPAPRGTPVQHIQAGTNIITGPTCNIGYSDPPANAENLIYFDGDDAYYTYLNVDSLRCANCGLNRAALIRKAHLELFFPVVPCTLTVRTGVVGITQATCQYQDSLSVLCPNFFTKLINPGPTGYVDFEIPFPDSCQIFTTPPQGIGQAFLEFKFATVNAACRDSLTKPQIAVRGASTYCTSWNPVGTTNVDIALEYTTGNPIMYAEIETCINTPTRRIRWGELKSIYR